MLQAKSYCECLKLHRNLTMTQKHVTANRNLEKVVAYCSEMLELADLGDNYRTDDGCGVVYGALRDSAYKIRRLAKEELAKHKSRTPPLSSE